MKKIFIFSSFLLCCFTINAADLKIESVDEPSNSCDLSTSTSVTVTISNLSSETADSFNIALFVNGPVLSGPYQNQVNIGIPPLSSVSYTVPSTVDMSAEGKYTIICAVTLTGDADPSNDTIITEVYHLETISSFPYQESFEGTDSGGWYVSGMNSSWFLGNPDKGTLTNASDGSQAWVNGGLDYSFVNSAGETAFYNPLEFNEVGSPCFDFSSLSSVVVRFDIWFDTEFGWDGSIFQYSTDDGNSWQNLATFTGNSNGWQEVELSVDQLAGESQVRFRLPFSSDGSVQDTGIAFDNFRISQSCNVNSQLSGNHAIAGITSARLYWVEIPGANGYQIRGRKLLPAPASSIVTLTVHGKPDYLKVTKILSKATYQWQVRAFCDSAATVYSQWSTIDQFTTYSCENPGNPYTDNISSNKATLHWDSISYPEVLGYRISGGTSGNFDVDFNIPNKNVLGRIVTQLSPSTTFNWRIIAACSDNGKVVFSDVDSAEVVTFTTASSKNEINTGENVMISPNPAGDVFSISTDIPIKVLRLYDLQGKLIYSKHSEDHINKVDISYLADGYYKILMFSERGEKITRSLSIKK